MRIAHLADIHIQDRRRDEYSNVLAKLYSSLREEKPDIIAVVGDVFDSKTKATANNFADVAKFLSALTEIAPVVLCPGNHDTNLSTPGALDLLTPVVAEHRGLQPPGLTYWRNTGVYAAHGIIWAVVAPDGPKPSSVEVDRARQRFEADGAVAPGAMQLCLFHEEVDGAALPNGMLLRDSRLTPKDFAPYDAALGGHIHQRQMITPRAGYCSSLVQQNIGESHVEHGYVLWEFTLDPSAAPYRTPIPVLKGVNIPNERGYLRVRLSGGQDVTQEPRPARPYYYEVMHDESTPEGLVTATVEELTEVMGFKPRAIRRKTDQLDDAERTGKESKLPDGLAKAQESARSVEVHEAIIRDLLPDSPVLEQVIKLHREKYAEVVPRNVSRARIRLLRLDFDNLYCYGPGNSVDFTRIERCLSGVVAQNYMGKSSLIDVIVFVLYDEFPRADTKKSIVNSTASSYRVTLQFELDGKTGCIEKAENMAGNSSLRRYRFMYAGEDLTQGDVKSTCAEIAKIVGSYEDAQLTTVSHQDGGADFVRQAPAQRKKDVARLLALGSFESLEKGVRDEHYACNASYKTLQEQSCKVPLAELEFKRDRAAGDAEDAAVATDEIKAEIGLLEAEQEANHGRELEISAQLAACSARRAGLEPSTQSSTMSSIESLQAQIRSLLAATGLRGEAEAREELAKAEYRAHTGGSDENSDVPSAGSTGEAWRSIHAYAAKAASHRAEAESARTALAAIPTSGGGAKAPREPADSRPADAAPWPECRKGERPNADTIEAARAFISPRPAVEYDNLVLAARAPVGSEPPYTEREGEYDALRSGADGDALLSAGLSAAKNARDSAARRRAALRAAQPPYMAEYLPTMKAGKMPAENARGVAESEHALEKAKARHAAVEAAQVLKDSISPRDGCPGCDALKRILSSDGLGDYRQAVEDAETGVAESRYAAAHKAAMELISAGDAVRRADTEISVAMKAAERAQRLQALEEERIAREAYLERKTRQAVWRQHLRAVNVLEAAAFWWDAAVKAWAAYDSEKAAFEADQASIRQRAELGAKIVSAKRQAEAADRESRSAGSTVARRLAALKQINSTAETLRQARTDEERKTKHRQAATEERELKALAQEAAKKRQETSERLKDLQIERDAQQKRIVGSKALEARMDVQVAGEAKRVAQITEIQERRNILEAYRRVLKTSGGIADRLLRQARGDLEAAINQILGETTVPFRVALDDDFGLAVGPAGGTRPAPSSGVASGCQKFIVSLASRYALWRLAEVPLLDAQIVDEGFAVCDEEHLEQVAQYLETAAALAAAPRLHFVVSHLDTLKNRLERPLGIERRPGGSYVANATPLAPIPAAAKAATAPKAKPAAMAKATTASKAKPAAAMETATQALAAPLPPDPDHAGNVWCEVCAASLTAARGARHLTTDVHARAVKRAAKRAE